MAGQERNEAVVIVGAGMAGLSAAEYLYKNGFTNVRLLEAKNRYGGRIWTEHFGRKAEDFVELGAQYMGGLSHLCSAYTLANQIGLKFNKSRPDEPARLPEKGQVYSSGGWVIEEWLIEEVNELLEDWWDEMEDVDKPTTMENSLNDFVRRKILPEFDKEEHEDVISYINYFKNWLRLMEGVHPQDFELYTDDWDNGQEDLPEPSVEVAGHMDSLVKEVASRFPAEWIQLCSPVTNIKWGADTSQVTCSVTGGSKSYTADYVIVTCPLGFLKANHQQLFEPELPKKKVEAIEAIPHGAIGKIFLEFDKPFWEPNLPEMTVAWREKDFPEDVGDAWWKRISHFEGAANSPNVLIAWITCEGSERIEKISEQEVSDGVMKLLRKLLRNPSLPDPVKVLKSGWSSDPYTLGVYSCKGMSQPKHRIALAAPLAVKGAPRVMFAGEATDKSFPGYMHGARDTGLRTAVKLVKHCRKKTAKAKL